MDSQVEGSEQSYLPEGNNQIEARQESEDPKLSSPENHFKRLRRKVSNTGFGRLAAGLFVVGSTTAGVVGCNTPPQHEDNSNLENRPSATVTAVMPSQEIPLATVSPPVSESQPSSSPDSGKPLVETILTPTKPEEEQLDKKAEKAFRDVITWYFNDETKKKIIDSLDRAKNPERNFSYQLDIKTDRRNPETAQDNYYLKLLSSPNADPKKMEIAELEVYIHKDGQEITGQMVKAIIHSADLQPFPFHNERPTTYEQIQQVVEGYLARPYEALKWTPVKGPDGEELIEGFKKIETKLLINSKRIVELDARTTISDSGGFTILEIRSLQQSLATRSAR